MAENTSSNGSQNLNAISEVMNETEIGAFLLKYKNFALGLLMLALFGAFGFGAYRYWDHQKSEKAATLAYQFRDGALKEFNEGKLDDKGLESQFNQMEKAIGEHRSLVLPLIESVDALLSKGKSKTAQILLEKGLKSYSKKDPFIFYFLGTRFAAVSEDLGQNDKAIKTLEELTKLKPVLLESKLNVDLGRLYLKANEKEKAKAHFLKVIDTASQSDMVKLARLYLADLGEVK